MHARNPALPVGLRPSIAARRLNRRRLTIYPLLLAIGLLCLWAYFLAGGRGNLDRNGTPIGADFIAFYAASGLALDERPDAAYDLDSIQAAESNAAGTQLPPVAWHYPPGFLLTVLPLSLLPYLPALALWLGVTTAAYLLVVRRISADPAVFGLALAFPGLFLNLTQGQNGCLSAALLGGGLLLLSRRPPAAGALLGLLSFKPQLAALVFLALLAGGQRRALVAAAVSALSFHGVATAVFGLDTALAFLRDMPAASDLLYGGRLAPERMHTASAALLLLGAPPLLAQALQAGVSLTAAAAVCIVWRAGDAERLRYAALGLGALLATPFMFDYDLVMLSLPLLWLGLEAQATGWLPWEREALFAGWWLPFLATAVVALSSLAAVPLMLSPFVLAGLLLLVLRRVRLAAAPAVSAPERRLVPAPA